MNVYECCSGPVRTPITEESNMLSHLFLVLPYQCEGDEKGSTRPKIWNDPNIVSDKDVVTLKNIFGLTPNDTLRPATQDFYDDLRFICGTKSASPDMPNNPARMTYTIVRNDDGSFAWYFEGIEFVDSSFATFTDGEFVPIAQWERISAAMGW
jgi:hypothetical protein